MNRPPKRISTSGDRGRQPRNTDPDRSRIRVAVWIAVAFVGASTIAPAASARTASGQPQQAAQTSERTSVTVGDLERATRAKPTDGNAWVALASAYVRRAYETSDPSFYPMAANAIERSARLLKNSPRVRTVRADLALALHDFARARTEANAVLALQPGSFEARVALADATVELGDYRAAEDIISSLVEQQPGVASFSRLSYIRQLNGDLLGAETAMRSAVSAAPQQSLARAAATAYLGEILLERGKGSAAKRAFVEALELHPESSVAAMGMARIQAADLDWTSAIATLDRVLDRVPVPGALGLSAEIARARNDRAGELAANQLVDASVALFRSNGAILDAEVALLLADRGPGGSAKALDAARDAYRARQTTFTRDAMAWTLMQAGRPKDAVPYIMAAIAMNPGVASVRWHAAKILHAVGRLPEARREIGFALRNRWFSPGERAKVVALARTLDVEV